MLHITVSKEAAMTSASSLADAVTEFAKTFTGQLLQPTDPGYEDVRKVQGVFDEP